MQRGQQLKWVGSLMALGLCAALPFLRREPARLDVLEPPAAAPLVQSVPLHLATESTPSPAVGLRDQDPPPAPPPTLVVDATGQQSQLEDHGVPPQLPERYHPLVEESGPLAPAAPHRPRALQVEEPRVRIRRVEEEPAPPRERTHRIVDGDTLAKIAQRYWQDASLAEALFAANRDQLNAPDPLPIGTLLRIPATPTKRSSRVDVAPQVETLPAPVRQPQAELKLDEPLVPFPRTSD